MTILDNLSGGLKKCTSKKEAFMHIDMLCSVYKIAKISKSLCDKLYKDKRRFKIGYGNRSLIINP